MSVSQLTAILKEKKHLTADVLFLSFDVSHNFTFEAGQYAIFKVINNDDFRMKSYSILNPPSEKGKLNICAKLIPGGFGSEAFKAMKPGEEITFRGPLGHLTFDSNGTEHWFIANGTGVVPFHSIIMENVPRHPQKEFNLIFGVKSQKDLFLHEEFTALSKRHPHFTYLPTLSRDCWEGSVGRVQQHLPEDLSSKIFYICGLKEMVLETQQLLLEKGVSEERIRVERYT